MPFFNFDPPKPPTRAELDKQDGENIAFALKHAEYLNDWERNFLVGASGYARLSGGPGGQRQKLGFILRKIEAAQQLRAVGEDR